MNPDTISALQAAGGGVLIGLASWLLFASIGRIAGVSGIAAAVLVPSQAEKETETRPDHFWRIAFLAGLVLGGALAALWFSTPTPTLRSAWLLVTAGLLVGVGTVLGSGCTSGHGVCGLGRRSGRSLAATAVFMAVGFGTTFVVFSLLGRTLI